MRSTPISLLFPLLLLLPACAKHELSGSRFMMDTLVELRASGAKLASLEQAWGQLKSLDSKLSSYGPGSDVLAANRAAGLSPVRVSERTTDLLWKTLEFSGQSSGIFDPTVLPLVDLWGVTAKNPRVPKAESVRKALELVNFNEVSAKDGKVFLQRRGMGLDLGGIAKGYAADLAVETLKASGAEEGLVNAGGNIKVFGNRTWRIGIRHPRDPKKVFAELELRDRAVATSGDYQRYFEKDGKRYHHILDLKTGYPARASVSVTIIANDGWLADALSTTVFIMGPKKGLEFLKNYPGTEGIVVDPEGNVFVSEGLKDEVKVSKIQL